MQAAEMEWKDLFNDARLARGWSVSQTARMLEVPEQTIKNWMKGGGPRYEHFLRCVLLFGWKFDTGTKAAGSNRPYSFDPRDLLRQPPILAWMGV